MFQVTTVEADFDGVQDYLQRLAGDLEKPKSKPAATENIYESVDWITKELFSRKNHPNIVAFREAAHEVLRLLFRRWQDLMQVDQYLIDMKWAAVETTKPAHKLEIGNILRMLDAELDFSDRPNGRKTRAKKVLET